MSQPFDPDAYLRAKRGAAVRPAPQPEVALPPPPEPEAQGPAPFDPDAYLAKKTAPQVGAGETFINRAANALPLGRPVVDLLTTGVLQGAKALGVGEAGARLTPQARAELGLPEEQDAIPDAVDSYRQARDRRDVRTDAGSEQNKWAGRAGTAFGIGLTALAPLPKSLGGAGVGPQALAAAAGRQGLGQVMRTGALLGGVQALGDSRADLTRGEVGHALLDAGIGTAAGAAGGALGYGIGTYAPPLLRAAGQKLREWGVSAGRRTLLNGADSLSTRLTSDEAVEEALKSGAILPMGTTQGAKARLEKLSDEVGATYGATVDALEGLGVQGPEVAPVADDLLWRGVREYFNTGSDKATSKLFQREAGNVGKLASGDTRLGLKQAENLKRDLQSKARYGRTEETLLNEARREAASVIRQANEDAIQQAAQQTGPNTEVAELAENFVPVKRRLGRLLEAEAAAQRGAQKAQNRPAFGLKDAVLMAGAGDPVSGAATAVGSRLFNTRGASTMAAGSYWGGRGLQGLGNLAALGVARGQLPAAGARLGGALERDLLPGLLPAGSPPALAEDEDERKRNRYRALLEALSE